jgi:hypothetical protein
MPERTYFWVPAISWKGWEITGWGKKANARRDARNHGLEPGGVFEFPDLLDALLAEPEAFGVERDSVADRLRAHLEADDA